MRTPEVGDVVRVKSSDVCFTVTKRSRTKDKQEVMLRGSDQVPYNLKDVWVPMVGDRVHAYRYNEPIQSTADLKKMPKQVWGSAPDPKNQKVKLWGSWEMVIVRLEGDRVWLSTLAFCADHARDMRFTGIKMPLTHVELNYESDDFEGFVYEAPRAIAVTATAAIDVVAVQVSLGV